jgi:hypothetical protein
MYDIELKRLKNTDKHALNLFISFDLGNEGNAQDAEIDAIRDKIIKLDQAAEAAGLKIDFGRATVVSQKNNDELLVFGVLELTDALPDPAAGEITTSFNDLAAQELGSGYKISHLGVTRFLPMQKFFPEFLKK